ncbi:UNVERIFIED_CONTAM: hypothetical protein FKN15_005521 [Acipenser sinensis]
MASLSSKVLQDEDKTTDMEPISEKQDEECPLIEVTPKKDDKLILYHWTQSFSSQKVRLAIAEKGLKCEEYDVSLPLSEHNEPWFMRLNPAGEVPVLIHGDTIICDATQIIDHLELSFVDENTPKLIPEEGSMYYPRVQHYRELLDSLPMDAYTHGCILHPEITVDSQIPTYATTRIRSQIGNTESELKKLAHKHPELQEAYVAKQKRLKSKLLDHDNMKYLKKILDELEKVLDQVETELQRRNEETPENTPKLIPEEGSMYYPRVQHYRELLDSLPMDAYTHGCILHPEITVDSQIPTYATTRIRSQIGNTESELKKLAHKHPELQEAYVAKQKRLKSKLLDHDNMKYLKKILDELEKVLDQVETELQRRNEETPEEGNQPWLCGQFFSVADVSLAVTLHRMKFLGLSRRYWGNGDRQNVETYYERVLKRKTFRRVLGNVNNILISAVLPTAFRVAKKRAPCFLGTTLVHSLGNIFQAYFLLLLLKKKKQIMHRKQKEVQRVDILMNGYSMICKETLWE